MTSESPQKAWLPVDDAALKTALVPLCSARFGEGAIIDDIESKRIHYAVCRLRIFVKQPDGGRLRWLVIEKAFADRRSAEHSFRQQQALIEAGFGPDAGDGVSAPESYAVIDGPPRLLMQDIGGEKLRGLLKTADGPFYSRLLARVLIKLNRSSLAGLQRYGGRRYYGQIESLRRKTAPAAPRIASILDALTRQAGVLAKVDVAPRPIHGGYHPGQVHYDGERAWLLDTGNVSRGDPAFDAGRLLSVLTTSADELAEPVAVRSAFLDEFLAGADAGAEARLPFFEALSLAVRLCNRLAKNETDENDPLVDVIEDRLGRLA